MKKIMLMLGIVSVMGLGCAERVAVSRPAVVVQRPGVVVTAPVVVVRPVTPVVVVRPPIVQERVIVR